LWASGRLEVAVVDGEFELDGCEFAESALPASTVVGVFDPGGDRKPQLFTRYPVTTVEEGLPN
jgi:hypothetical protein